MALVSLYMSQFSSDFNKLQSDYIWCQDILASFLDSPHTPVKSVFTSIEAVEEPLTLSAFLTGELAFAKSIYSYDFVSSLRAHSSR